MEIILLQDITNLGHKDDIVKVRDGYGRNLLIPKGMAVSRYAFCEENAPGESQAAFTQGVETT
jgi:ribosomal protein L9